MPEGSGTDKPLDGKMCPDGKVDKGSTDIYQPVIADNLKQPVGPPEPLGEGGRSRKGYPPRMDYLSGYG